MVRSFRKKKVGEKERVGDFAPGTKKVTAITQSLGQTFHKLDDEETPYYKPLVRGMEVATAEMPCMGHDAGGGA